MRNKALRILLILAFIKGIVWMVMTPIFQVPDESSHFSIIQIIAETGKRPHPRRERITSKELMTVSQTVGFNWEINHPVWQGYADNWQKQINQVPDEWRSSFVQNQYQTSLKRPPLYYWLATPFYLIFHQQSFLFRFFSVRFLSVLISLITAYFVLRLSQLVFKSKSLCLAAVCLVIFQPMFSFINIGVHYDSLVILTATIFLYLGAKYLRSRKKKYLYWNLIIGLMGLFIKPDLIVLPLVSLLLFPKKKLKVVIPVALGILVLLITLPKILISGIPINNVFIDKFRYLINFNEYSNNFNRLSRILISGQFLPQLQNYLVNTWQMHLAQIFPWYWGVFGWLEKVMPAFIYQGLKILILFSLIGWLRFTYRQIKKPSFSKTTLKIMKFLVFSTIAHLGLVVLNDFRFFTASGINYGIQGRYLLPFISVHMILLVLGLSQLVPEKHYRVLAIGLIIFSFSLNLAGLFSLYQYFGWVWL